uniref:Uncharacterized protein n=1 Tax=Salix viminalis TaxID=40686 RepID=A0A6N2MGN7_SALVM
MFTPINHTLSPALPCILLLASLFTVKNLLFLVSYTYIYTSLPIAKLPPFSSGISCSVFLQIGTALISRLEHVEAITR